MWSTARDAFEAVASDVNEAWLMSSAITVAALSSLAWLSASHDVEKTEYCIGTCSPAKPELQWAICRQRCPFREG